MKFKDFKDTKYGDLSGQTYDGDIDVKGLNLISLYGAPEVVNGDFSCVNNKLTSLAGAPKEVNGDFDCSGNYIKSLDDLLGSDIKGKIMAGGLILPTEEDRKSYLSCLKGNIPKYKKLKKLRELTKQLIKKI